jgi:hypothetical protein
MTPDIRAAPVNPNRDQEPAPADFLAERRQAASQHTDRGEQPQDLDERLMGREKVVLQAGAAPSQRPYRAVGGRGIDHRNDVGTGHEPKTRPAPPERAERPPRHQRGDKGRRRRAPHQRKNQDIPA